MTIKQEQFDEIKKHTDQYLEDKKNGKLGPPIVDYISLLPPTPDRPKIDKAVWEAMREMAKGYKVNYKLNSIVSDD